MTVAQQRETTPLWGPARRYGDYRGQGGTQYGALELDPALLASRRQTGKVLRAVAVATTVFVLSCVALSAGSAGTARGRATRGKGVVDAQLVADLPDCQCINECDTTTPTGLHYCIIGDDGQCQGIYGNLAVDSIDGSTTGDGLYESYCGIIYGSYDCGGDPCENGGYCIDGMNTYTCVCQEGFTGADCEQDIDECAEEEAVCAEHAGCSNTQGSYSCSCLSGYTGNAYNDGDGAAACEDVDDCASEPCENGGACSDAGANTFHCSCQTGWIGAMCEVDVDECMDGTDTCDDDARCINRDGGYECHCNLGFTGDGMSGSYTEDGLIVDYAGCSDINDCANSPCLNEGTCKDSGPQSFMCVCATGWDGLVCDHDINECLEDTHKCDPNALCNNNDGGYTCACDHGFTGDGESCTDADDCVDDPCRNGSRCVDGGLSQYSCNCKAGWVGVQCEVDKNECAQGEHFCDENAECVDTPGSYTCNCNLGFEGDGAHVCQDVNDCAENPCEHGACTDTGVESYKCVCEHGWTDTNCDMDVNECQSNTHHCDPAADCANVDGSYTCTCNDGYDGDGLVCKDVDDCAAEPCMHGACKDTGVNSFECECRAGWTDTVCDFDVDECALQTHQCHQHARCANTEGSYTCSCEEGWEGDGVFTCSDINDCASSPCKNGACKDVGPGQFECHCDPGWKDTHCDYDVNECVAKTHDCDTNANCVNTPGSYSCRCQRGWEGDGFGCTDVNDCEPDPCVYGTCADMGAVMYQCECADGWQSDNCDVDVDECLDAVHACDVRASCTNHVGGYVCDCNAEYYGDGESCYPCHQCEKGFIEASACDGTDRTCEDIDECTAGTHNCHLDAECKNTEPSFVCACKEGFFGDGTHCEACTECGVGFHEKTACAGMTDRTCEVNVKDGLYMMTSEADGSEKCLVFSAEGSNQYPERYDWGNSPDFCGIPTINGMTGKEALLKNRQAVFRLTRLEKDLYTIESDADGKGWRCLRFGMGGVNQYPDRYNWGEGDGSCGFQAQEGASVEESLVADGQAVWKLVPLDGPDGTQYMVQSNADHAGWKCLVFGGHGYDTNPRRLDFGNGDEYCGVGHWGGLSLKDALLDNKQAVWSLNFIMGSGATYHKAL